MTNISVSYSDHVRMYMYMHIYTCTCCPYTCTCTMYDVFYMYIISLAFYVFIDFAGGSEFWTPQTRIGDDLTGIRYPCNTCTCTCIVILMYCIRVHVYNIVVH